MRAYDSMAVAAALDWLPLIEAIEVVVANPNAAAPGRSVHEIVAPGLLAQSSRAPALLVKPGWVLGDVIAVKAVTFFPDNGLRDLPMVNAGVLLFSAIDGTLLGACDGNELTTRRTAAASAVAAKRLARTDVTRLLVVGTGALAPMVAEAHASVRTYSRVEVWGRRPDEAERVAKALLAGGLPASAVADLDAAVATAHVISCVTGATKPIVKGELLQPGTHLDLIGSFAEEMREADDEAVRRGSVWVDTVDDAVLAGDLAQPIQAGVISIADLRGDLRDLVSGPATRRTDHDEITVFKSVGTALEDVAAAQLVFSG